ncbi:carboxypeptidase-like regulatory domain-containing protein [Myxococcota bacterium]|nr:carboxypeptidase-like regulatory domain-containing protein [Myxococcota bacterium]
MKAHRRRIPHLLLYWMFLALVAASGCSEIPASNPYDPATPESQRAAGTISGILTVPGGFRRVLTEQTTRVVVYSADRRVDDGGLVDAVASAGPCSEDVDVGCIRANGAFAFNVSAGAYRLEAGGSGLNAATMIVTVAPGQQIHLGSLVLSPLDQLGSIVGDVREISPDGTPGGPVSGATVSVRGRPWGTLTDDAGHFEFEVPTGRYELDVSREGYDAPEGGPAQVETGVALPDPIFLRFRPGSIRGVVGYEPRFGWGSPA